MNNIFHKVWAVIIVLASTRGALVYHFGFKPELTYIISATLLFAFGLFSFWSLISGSLGDQFPAMKNAVKLNFLFLSFSSLASFLLSGYPDFGLVYQFSIFPTIFLLTTCRKDILQQIVLAVVIVTTLGVYLVYAVGADGDYDTLVQIQQKLRPEEDSISRIDDLFLSGG